jgi:dephospho-CoA kinase
MKTKVIGLTGGIGSGKTTIAKYFGSLGMPVYIADEEAKKILDSADVVQEVAASFGKEVLTDGLPDRKKLAGIVFNSPEKLGLLNSIIHPKVKESFEAWVAANSNEPFVIKEAAILFESGSYKDCDKVILVTAPEDVRVSRVMERDNMSREDVMLRMANQWTDNKKIPLSDYIINNTVLEEAKEEVRKLVKELRKI